MKKQLFFLISLTVVLNSLAQNVTGYARVLSTTNIVIPNAKVMISPVADTTTVYQYISDKNGNYYYDFPENGSDYIFKVLSSNQTLQFNNYQTNKTLSSGSNNFFFNQVQLTNSNGIKFTVVDTAGNPVENAKVLLYDTKRKWRIDSCSIAKSIYTNANGEVEINSLSAIEYWFNIKNGYENNRFTVKNTTSAIDTTQVTNIDVTIRDLTQNELYLCGLCDNKVWVTDSMVVFGSSQEYDADSKLLSDGTWWDSNGNHGFWWFNPDETTLTYDYDSSSTNAGGSQVEATNLVITDTSFVGDMEMSGFPITYYMSMYHDTTNFNLNVNDTIIYIGAGEEITLNPEDLYLTYNWNFNYILSLNPNTFDETNVGSNDVGVKLLNRCGETETHLMHVTIILTDNIETLSKNNIEIYPNPAKNILNISSKNGQIKTIDIFDISGKQVKCLETDKEQLSINIADLKQGVYFIKLNTKNGVSTHKLIVE